jgi:hypothetical protein
MRGRIFVKRIVVVVLGLLLAAGCGGSDGDGKPGRIVTDPRGFRYVVWPFTFNGLTVGRPIDKLDQISALGFGDSVMAKAKAYLKKNNLSEADLAVHQRQALGLERRVLDSRKLGADRTRKYLGPFFDFFKIKNVNYQRLRAWFNIDHGTIVALQIQGGERPVPLAPDADLAKFTAVLGKADLVIEVKFGVEIAPKMSAVKWYVWRNMICWVHQDRVVRVDIHSGPHQGLVGPRPRDEKSFSCGWIMPWNLIQRLARRPDLYRMLRQAAEARGVAWRPENDFLIYAIKQSMSVLIAAGPAWGLQKTFPNEDGFVRNHEACYRGLAPLLPYLFPGLKIDPQKLKIDHCWAFFRPPAIIVDVNMSFERPGWLTRAEFERIHGSPDKVWTEKYRVGVGHELFYLKKRIKAVFLNGRLTTVYFDSGPIIYPPPR